MTSHRQLRNRSQSGHTQTGRVRLPVTQTTPRGIGTTPAQLQRRLGNRGTQAWLAEQVPVQQLQSKLTVGQPGDINEQEADRVAETVMSMPEPAMPEEEEAKVQAKPIANQVTPLVRRMPEEAVAEEPIVQQMSELESEQEEETTVAAKPLIQRMSYPEPEEDDEEEEIAQAKLEKDNSSNMPRQKDEDEDEDMVQAKPVIQRQSEEEEEETVQAKQFLSNLPSQASSTVPGANNSPYPSIQRLCTDCKEEMQRQPDDEEELAQAKPLENQQFVAREPSVQPKGDHKQTPQVSPATAANIDSLKGGGRPLPRSAQSFFEPRFGADFSQVRIHTDTRAAETAKSINAKAFTVGRDIAFGGNQYAPESHGGRRLLAHELTHVVQQDQGRVQPKIQRSADIKSVTTCPEFSSKQEGVVNSDGVEVYTVTGYPTNGRPKGVKGHDIMIKL